MPGSTSAPTQQLDNVTVVMVSLRPGTLVAR